MAKKKISILLTFICVIISTSCSPIKIKKTTTLEEKKFSGKLIMNISETDESTSLKEVVDDTLYYSITHDKEEREKEASDSVVRAYDATLIKYHIPSKTKTNLFTMKGVIYDVKYHSDKLYVSTYEKQTSIVKIIEINGNEQKIIDQYHVDSMLQIPNLIRYDNTLCYVKSNNKQLSVNCLNGKSYHTEIPEDTFSYIPMLNHTESIFLRTKKVVFLSKITL